jgi:hypothetical protein
MKFRFQDLQIWQFAIEISDELLDKLMILKIKNYFDFLNNLEELP